MELNEMQRKALCFATQLMNAYRDEDEREYVEALTLKEQALVDDFTAMLIGMCYVYQRITGDDDKDLLDFTHMLNKLAFQYLMEPEGDTK